MRTDETGRPYWYDWNRRQYRRFWSRLLKQVRKSAKTGHSPRQIALTNAELFADKWFSCISGAWCPGPEDEQASTEAAQAFAERAGLRDTLEHFEEKVYLRKWNEIEALISHLQVTATIIKMEQQMV